MSVVGLNVGKVGRAHGLNGSFFVSGRSSPLPKTLKNVRIGPTWETARPVTVMRIGMQSGRPLLQIEGILQREDVTAIVGETIWAERDALVLEEGAWCFADLIGKTVVSADEVTLGVIDAVENYGAGDFVELSHPEKGRLAITLAGDYVDWKRSAAEKGLRLAVAADTFEECWEKPRA